MQDLTGTAGEIFEQIRGLPIVSPHGHTDPEWFAQDRPFSDAAELLVIPDHYVFRMLYSQGIPLEALGVGPQGAEADRRQVFRLFAQNWRLFLGTPSQLWIGFVLRQTLGVTAPLDAQTADVIFDQIGEKLASPEFRPRALFDRFNIEVLATTDSALDTLAPHRLIANSEWPGRVIPTFRPDAVLDPLVPGYAENLQTLAELTGVETNSFGGYLAALRARRMFFKSCGATATDHAIDVPQTGWLTDPEVLFNKALTGTISGSQARALHGHMLIEMAQMSVEDGLVMQLHAGSRRNTNQGIFAKFGADKGADIPLATDWVRGLEPLLNRVGSLPEFRLILFTLDESTYARELAPMAGHWPCLRVGPPWWFHDSVAGIARFFDRVVETAGYANLAGFNDDTRAFMSIPARHDLWRRGVALHLSDQVSRGYFNKATANQLAEFLATDAARTAYRL